MSKVVGPDLRKLMDKKITVKLNANRRVTGILRGFDQFMNIVLEDTVEEVSHTERNEIGMVVIRGNSIVIMEPIEHVP
ncbi:small nuclear ribonucleoprotein g [Pelomyxa schiedti]|nr:small nuclear ribonucleoprotein g [Pelomyxa schiedti]